MAGTTPRYGTPKMRDIIVEDIPEEHYLWLCEEAAKRGITADDYLTLLVKDYARERRAKMQAEADAPK